MNAFRIHFYIFILLWICYGVWNFFHRISFILEIDLEEYNIWIDCTRIMFQTYIISNPMIYTCLIKPEVTECWIEVMNKECQMGNLRESFNIEEETAIYGELDTTVRVTYPKTIQSEQTDKPSVCFVSVDVHHPPLDV